MTVMASGVRIGILGPLEVPVPGRLASPAGHCPTHAFGKR
jgi:hypothetical protein